MVAELEALHTARYGTSRQIQMTRILGTAYIGHALYDSRKLHTPEAIREIGVFQMEQSVAVLDESAVELRRARQELINAREEFLRDADLTIPPMLESLKAVRSARMALSTETTLALTALRDVRKFFLDDAHAEEIKRLESFVALCRALGQLAADGTLDAVCDSALRLAVGKKE